MGGAFKPGRLLELLEEMRQLVDAQGHSTLAEAVEEVRERLVHPENWRKFPIKAKRLITRDQYMQLVGIVAASTEQQKILKSLELAACAITGEDDNAGHTTDILWGSRELDEGLEILGVGVEP
jgi:hypothetical protein